VVATVSGGDGVGVTAVALKIKDRIPYRTGSETNSKHPPISQLGKKKACSFSLYIFCSNLTLIHHYPPSSRNHLNNVERTQDFLFFKSH
jgi:hypothetical protein